MKTLYGKKVILKSSDNKLWHEFYKNFTTDPILDTGDYTYDFDCAEKDFYSKTSDLSRQYFFILLKENVIGQIYLKHINLKNKTAEFGIAIINDSFKDKGFGTDAIKTIIDYAFNTLKIKAISADILKNNFRSQHVLEKLSFKHFYTDSQFKFYKLENKK